MEEDFAAEYQKPVEQILGPETLKAVEGFDAASACIISKSVQCKTVVEATPITTARALLPEDCEALRQILLEPTSYWNGRPKYRRLPPKAGFAISILHNHRELGLLIDLMNPGWTFYCDGEFYWGFNFANKSLVPFAKSIFPEYASSAKQSVWKKGAIATLELNAKNT